jgi:SsrA-binding protein
MKNKKDTRSVNIINRKARFDYHIERAEVAGIQLMGSEVKAIRSGHINMSEAFCVFEGGELWIRNMHITSPGNAYSHDPVRARKVLLKRKELNKLEKDLIKGYTIIPIRLFSNAENLLKVEVCLAKGKKQYDKRETIKERDVKRELSREEKC